VKTHHDLPSSINVGVEQSKDVLERNVGLGRSENGRPMEIGIEWREGRVSEKQSRGRRAWGIIPATEGSMEQHRDGMEIVCDDRQ